MDCRLTHEHLSAYVDGELEPEFVRELEAHLVSCAGCREELDSLKQLTGLLHRLPRHKAPTDIEREVVSYIERDALLRGPVPARRTHAVRRTLTALTLTAAVTLVAVSAYLQFFHVEPPSTDRDLGIYLDTPRPGAGLAANQPELAGDATEKPDRDKSSVELDHVEKAGEPYRKNGGPLAPRPDYAGPESQVAQAPPGAKAAQTKGETGEAADVTAALVRPGDISPLRGVQAGAGGGTAVDRRAEAAPEVLKLVLAAEDFEAARNKIITIAGSLDIRPVTYGWSAGGRVQYGAVEPADEAKDAEAARVPRERFTPAAAKPKAEATGAGRTAGMEQAEDRPALVLAVEEEKLPQLVARLAAELFTRGDETEVYYFEVDRLGGTIKEMTHAKRLALKAGAAETAETEAKESPAPTRDAAAQVARQPRNAKRPADADKPPTTPPAEKETEALPSTPTPGVPADKKAPRLVYIHIYIEHPAAAEPAAEKN